MFEKKILLDTVGTAIVEPTDVELGSRVLLLGAYNM
jgi:hypothetical protein